MKKEQKKPRRHMLCLANRFMMCFCHFCISILIYSSSFSFNAPSLRISVYVTMICTRKNQSQVQKGKRKKGSCLIFFSLFCFCRRLRISFQIITCQWTLLLSHPTSIFRGVIACKSPLPALARNISLASYNVKGKEKELTCRSF